MKSIINRADIIGGLKSVKLAKQNPQNYQPGVGVSEDFELLYLYSIGLEYSLNGFRWIDSLSYFDSIKYHKALYLYTNFQKLSLVLTQCNISSHNVY